MQENQRNPTNERKETLQNLQRNSLPNLTERKYFWTHSIGTINRKPDKDVVS
jgi:hypothetical protein